MILSLHAILHNIKQRPELPKKTTYKIALKMFIAQSSSPQPPLVEAGAAVLREMNLVYKSSLLGMEYSIVAAAFVVGPDIRFAD